MCGIAGVVARDRDPQQAHVLDAMSSRLRAARHDVHFLGVQTHDLSVGT